MHPHHDPGPGDLIADLASVLLTAFDAYLAGASEQAKETAKEEFQGLHSANAPPGE